MHGRRISYKYTEAHAPQSSNPAKTYGLGGRTSSQQYLGTSMLSHYQVRSGGQLETQESRCKHIDIFIFLGDV